MHEDMNASQLCISYIINWNVKLFLYLTLGVISVTEDFTDK